MIVPIAKQGNCYVWDCNPASKFSILYSDNIGPCHDTATVLQAA
ncbi:Glycosyltransferase involved in cell wall bisynthesis [Nostoc flagelliforme CCNUN1]|uniref:Glycosyltransferase involved in cell wall bisynthesis n=1 Tax=Nostoc flagelliforme CCNUN1 TaxID=2038116 RepID=A0A2K8SMJ8_9NOSO|nr:Glycosyltransferase involved in cell wall bisynthesis [Nostoc flagelliforme CCNUN1]